MVQHMTVQTQNVALQRFQNFFDETDSSLSRPKWRLDMENQLYTLCQGLQPLNNKCFKILKKELEKDGFGFNAQLVKLTLQFFPNVYLDTQITFEGKKCTLLHALIDSQSHFIVKSLHSLLIKKKLICMFLRIVNAVFQFL